MIKIMVSACLLGERVRYDGSENRVDSYILNDWGAEGRLLSFCPELAGGLGIPRAPAEICQGNGFRVLKRQSSVITNKGTDVSEAFILGAEKALTIARKEKVQIAILKEGSPSCASSTIYDGSFSGLKIRGQGVTSALLDQHGIRVFNEKGILAAFEYLKMLENN